MAYRKAEILSPAGTFDCLKAAIDAGADAVYVGGKCLNARAYAGNLDEDAMLGAIDYVHLHGRKIYMTVNTLVKSQEMEALYAFLLPYYERGLDGVIVQDMGVFSFLRKYFKDLSVHISTQCGVASVYGARFFEQAGAKRIIPARELSLEEIRTIRDGTGLEIECFVHGALCYCYSGSCLLSSMIGGRSGNRGQCAGPCRLSYSVRDKEESTLLSMKDLCAIERIPDLMDAGVSAFKIEGRMKQPGYVESVTRFYRKYMDIYAQDGPEGFHVSKEDLKKLQNAYMRRGYTDGYFKRQNGREMISFARPEKEKNEPEEAYLPEEANKIPVDGTLQLTTGAPACLTLHCQNNTVTVYGGIAQEARTKPLTQEQIRRQIEKTGETPFTFSHLDIRMDAPVFMPVKALNTLRRDGLAALTDACLSAAMRPRPDDHPQTSALKKEAPVRGEALQLTALVSTFAQLNAVLKEKEVKRIYVDAALGLDPAIDAALMEKPEDTQIYLACPYVFREAAALDFESHYTEILNRYDGVMIRSMDAYAWFKEKQYPYGLAADDTVYVFQKMSRDFLVGLGITDLTAPAELNAHELKELGLQAMTLPVYGYHPVMVSAGCIKKNTASCDHKEGVLYIRDRMGMKFPVKNFCRYCYNVIYNCSPLMLLDQKEEVLELSPRYIRLDFTIESGRETDRILSLARSFIDGHPLAAPREGGFTRGHFKRGVK